MDSNMLFLPLCSLSLVRLICSEAVAIIKSGNVKRHYLTAQSVPTQIWTEGTGNNIWYGTESQR